MKILLITNAPFLKAGNQSLRRTIFFLNELGVDFELWLLGDSSTKYSIPLNIHAKKFQSKFFSFLKKISVFFSSWLKKIRITNIKRAKRKAQTGRELQDFPPISKTIPIRNEKDYIGWFVHIPWVLLYSLKVLLHAVINWRKVKEFDIIWGYERGGVVPAFLLSKLFKKALVTSFQGTVLFDYLKTYGVAGTLSRQPLDFLTSKIRAKLIVITDDGTKGLEAFVKLGHNADNILFLPNGVSLPELREVLEAVDCREEENEVLKFVVAKRLTTFGRIERSVLLASELVRVGFTDFKLFIIGDGPEYNKLNALVKRNDIERQVVLLGALPYEETMKYVSCCDMVWSFNDSSNLTNTIQDALAIGKYVLTLNDGSLEGFLKLSPGIDRNKILLVNLENFLEEATAKILDWKKDYVDKKYKRKQNICLAESVWTWEKRAEEIYKRLEKLVRKDTVAGESQRNVSVTQ